MCLRDGEDSLAKLEELALAYVRWNYVCPIDRDLREIMEEKGVTKEGPLLKMITGHESGLKWLDEFNGSLVLSRGRVPGVKDSERAFVRKTPESPKPRLKRIPKKPASRARGDSFPTIDSSSNECLSPERRRRVQEFPTEEIFIRRVRTQEEVEMQEEMKEEIKDSKEIKE